MTGTLSLLATEVLLGQGPTPTPTPNPNPNSTGAEFGKAAPAGLVLVLLLLVGLILLIRSMNRHMRKLPTEFDQAKADAESGPAGPAGSTS
ncbi:hypothetical protein [Rhodococcus sp. X156]|uniref:hypothetical protein n=1 Tax=Rhodococcus sp. X156 TaxID=2499145 RepID=UPI0013E2DA04|nr:hypothetical protein [Rhodococcus sp. X156]